MQIVIDEVACVGHGECEAIAPEVFRLTESGLAELLDADPPAALLPAVRKAVLLCPADAINIID